MRKSRGVWSLVAVLPMIVIVSTSASSPSANLSPSLGPVLAPLRSGEVEEEAEGVAREEGFLEEAREADLDIVRFSGLRRREVMMTCGTR